MVISDILKSTPVIPVVAIERVDDAVPIAEALLHGGITVIEVTLRTDVALASIAAIRSRVPSMCVGAGTLCQLDQFASVRDVGANFAVSPGFAPALAAAARAGDLPFLPGVMTPSDIIAA